jgi:hypothetical protein
MAATRSKASHVVTAFVLFYLTILAIRGNNLTLTHFRVAETSQFVEPLKPLANGTANADVKESTNVPYVDRPIVNKTESPTTPVLPTPTGLTKFDLALSRYVSIHNDIHSKTSNAFPKRYVSAIVCIQWMCPGWGVGYDARRKYI